MSNWYRKSAALILTIYIYISVIMSYVKSVLVSGSYKISQIC